MKKTAFLFFSFLLLVLSGHAQSDSAQASPYQLLQVKSFAASVVDKSIQLTWTVTANEEARNFEIERADDGVSFRKIGGRLAVSQPGAAVYEFVDALPRKNTAFTYRVRVNGKDGSMSLSTLQPAKIDEAALHCKLKRNPVGGSIEVEITAAAATQVLATVLTNQGQKLPTESARLSAGPNTVSFALPNLQAGLHRLVLEVGSERKVLSFVKE